MRFGLSLAILLFAMIAVPSSAALAADQDFTLVNKTGYTIHQIYVSPANTTDWEEDVLGKGKLEDGESFELKFHRKETAEKWDLKVVYEIDNSSVIWEDLNLTKISKITLHYDKKADKTSADIE